MTSIEQIGGEKRRAVQEELDRVLGSPEFAGSERSCTLLRHLVEHALGGHGPALKERTVGIEVFGREISYDTGRDAIVRVSANSVRKRLAAYYGRLAEVGREAGWEIHLPAGSYTPEFAEIAASGVAEEPVGGGAGEKEGANERASEKAKERGGRRMGGVVLAALSGVLAVACGVLLWQNLQLRQRVAPSPGLELLPWSEFGAQKTVRVVLTDGNIGMYQYYTRKPIELEDYSRDDFTYDFNTRFPQAPPYMRGTSTSVFSAVAAARISAMLQTTNRTALLVPARRMQIDAFKGEQPVILLGSLVADPWITLFRDTINFSIELDLKTGVQFVANHRPLPGEEATYYPKGATPVTGTSYAILSMVPNLTGKGKVVLIAGTNGEGTGAAAELLTDAERLKQEMARVGLNPTGPAKGFELLLKVECFGSEPRRYEVIASRKAL